MLTPEYLYKLPDPIAMLYSETETDILILIAERLIKTGEISNLSKFQINKLKQQNILNQDVVALLKKALNKADSEIEKLLEQAGIETVRADDEIYLRFGLEPPLYTDNPNIKAIIETSIQKTKGLMRNFTNFTVDMTNKTYVDLIDEAYYKVVTNTYTRPAAIFETIRELANRGLETVDYPSGHVDKIDVAVRRNIITGANKMSLDLQVERSEQVGNRYMGTTSHMGARPSHAEWQGGVYDLHGDEMDGNISITGYGEGWGLGGWNCRHGMYPFLPGMDRNRYVKNPAAVYDNADNDEMYKQSQILRNYERKIRDTKRSLYTYQTAIDNSDGEYKKAYEALFQRKSVLLRKQTNAYKSYAAETNQLIDTNRTFVHTQTRSIAQKARYAADRYENGDKLSIPNYNNRREELDTRLAEIIVLS